MPASGTRQPAFGQMGPYIRHQQVLAMFADALHEALCLVYGVGGAPRLIAFPSPHEFERSRINELLDPRAGGGFAEMQAPRGRFDREQGLVKVQALILADSILIQR